MLRWVLDNDGDLTLSFFGRIHFTYYKWSDSTVIRWGKKNWQPAPKETWRKIHA